jgi:hypothetical protein
MNWSWIVAANSDAILTNCLASSPCIRQARDFNVMRGFASAGAAYNAGMRQAAGDILVFAHQDLYLPPGWEDCLSAAIWRLSKRDPQWAVLGVFGISSALKRQGYLYCTGLQKVLGAPFDEPIECISLDEVLLVIRRSSGLTFDEQLPGFHLYGTDICLEAKQRGLRSYIVSAFCLHNTDGMKFLPWAFWRSYYYLRHKRREELPIRTLCTSVTFWAWPAVSSLLSNLYVHYIKCEQPGRRVPNPEALYARLVSEQPANLQVPAMEVPGNHPRV